MSDAPGTTRVTILDEPFAIRSEADPEYTRQVAGHVDSSLREIRQKAPSMELRQMVNRESEWLLSDIERVFGLESGRAAELLRIVGFVEVSTTPSTWRDLRE